MVCSALVALALIAQPLASPNVVLILADDLGIGELGCYGQSKIQTPNLDRLAKEGVRFTRFYSPSPVCAPTRASLLTGKHQGHCTIRGNKEAGPGFGPTDPEGQFPLPTSEPTIAEFFKSKGYQTALVGKWGLGGPSRDGNPLAHGFDRFYGYLCQRRAHNYYPAYLWSDYGIDQLVGNPIFNAHQKLAQAPTDPSAYDAYSGKVFAPERMHEEAAAFIKANKSKPFFLYYAPTLPHVALQAPKPWVDRYPTSWDPKPYLGERGYLPTERPRATYAAMISYLDDSVGKLMDELDQLGLRQNTLVVFTSDNGPTFAGGVDVDFFNSAAGLRGLKMSLYEGGIRVPTIVRWPGKTQAGRVDAHLGAAWDLFATFRDVLATPGPHGDGVSLVPYITNQGPTPKRPYLYFEYPEASSMQAVIWGRYKAIKPDLTKHPEKLEIYDLDSDPSESKDIALSRPDLVKEAMAILTKEHIPNKDFPLPGVDRKAKK